jgi:hypothetical protein
MMNSRYFPSSTRAAGISALALGVGLALSACGPATSSAAGAASSAAATSGAASSAVAASAAASSVTATASASAPAAVPTAAPSATLVPMQTTAGGEFLSPSGNISCEVDYHRAGLTQVYCQTVTPARSVTMGAAGSYKTCTGQQCLGNSGTGTPTLAYGTATGAGPFRCTSAAAGITCVAAGKGFQISTAGITPVSG